MISLPGASPKVKIGLQGRATGGGMKRPQVVFVVLAGGRGERLWPLVRRNRPKISIMAGEGRSILRATVDRLKAIDQKASWLFITTQDQARWIREELPRSFQKSIVVEPEGRNTAACITLAAQRIAFKNPQRIMVVVPADHWIGDMEKYKKSVKTAIRVAFSKSTLVTIGVRPTSARTGLGYLVPGRTIKGRWSVRVRQLTRFVEKPSSVIAKKLIKGGAYWNSGIFVGSAGAFLVRLEKNMPRHVDGVLLLAQKGTRSLTACRAYRKVKSTSFDQGVMEHLRDALMVQGDFDWEDLGSWDALSRHVTTNSDYLISVDSQNITAVSEEPHLIAVIGLKDIVIVRTSRATLVCARDHVQAVRRVAQRIDRQPRFAGYR